MDIQFLTKKLVFINLFIISISVTAGCATTQGDSEAVSNIKNAFKNMGDGIKNLASGIGNKSDSSSNKTGFIATKYSADEVPHTLMKKPVKSGRLTSGFGYRLNPKGVRLPKRHKGVDYVAAEGTPIYAAGDGEVTKIYVSSSYGNYIKIQHANGFATAYAHMHEFAPGLEKGSQVTKGQLIGTVGSTGRSTGPHLHYEMLYNGKFIDPLF